MQVHRHTAARRAQEHLAATTTHGGRKQSGNDDDDEEEDDDDDDDVGDDTMASWTESNASGSIAGARNRTAQFSRLLLLLFLSFVLPSFLARLRLCLVQNSSVMVLESDCFSIFVN